MSGLWPSTGSVADDRSNGKWLEVFNDAGLKLVKEEVQVGMPEELFVVKT
jgi:protein N-terminal methyltransferase